MKRCLAMAVTSVLLAAATPLLSMSAANAASAAVKPPAALKVLIPFPFTTAAQAPGTFTGDAAEWAVGIVAGKTDALAYLCDGKNPGQWFGVSIKNGALTGTAPNGSVINASLKSGAWSGTVSLKGKPVSFTAQDALGACLSGK